MADLKLPKLPDRTALKLTVSLLPDLHRALLDYAAVYFEAYDEQVSIADLVPFMLSAFLDADRAFQRSRRGRVGSKEAGSE
ncbi:conserved protein of unknown function [uncultured Sphingopyxis sp.]|jgi:hypothetical protein|uniref:Protein involved in integration/excision of ICE Tn4371 family n=1 Tax=uncultured Sphingopyxis sp. TaxID=310581 RepID=A0A1Y5PTC1_9SPHN|nr:DUF2274 domain-containing protein [uncultured Sphingopyxis sp.]SBV31885.1 conserved protein of unknown function [uncultured Sphingopyxis sp.]